jgi:serine/threonine protein kinase
MQVLRKEDQSHYVIKTIRIGELTYKEQVLYCLPDILRLHTMCLQQRSFTSIAITICCCYAQMEAINEVTILARMDSPHIVQYFDSFVEDDTLHIVMEFCNRGDLSGLLKQYK